MTNSYDRSDKDKKYFIDNAIYNCPFCKRRHVKYAIVDRGNYNTSPTPKSITYFYITRCEDCAKCSLHLSKYNIKTLTIPFAEDSDEEKFADPLKQIIVKYDGAPSYTRHETEHDITEDGNILTELDDVFFYNDPSEFFTIDDRIPSSIRKPLSEANNTLKNNFLTGASACLRKAMYKFLKEEGILETKHDDRVDLLKKKRPNIDPTLLDELKAIHTLTSQELHENDWEDFNGKTIRFLISVLKEILIEIYVAPDEKRKRRKEMSALKAKSQKITGGNEPHATLP